MITRLAQRRGLGIGGRAGTDEVGGPLYVVAIDATSNQVIVGPQKALACVEVHLGDVNWINGAPADNTLVLARLRNTAPAMPARVFCHEDGGAAAVVVSLDKAQYGIAAGQAAAIYDGANPDQLLGGGWIARAPLVANIDQDQ